MGQESQTDGRRGRLSCRRAIHAGHETVALAAMFTALIEHVLVSGLCLLGLCIAARCIMFMMHRIEHQHMSADDQQQCPDQ